MKQGLSAPPLLHCARYHERAKAQVEIGKLFRGRLGVRNELGKYGKLLADEHVQDAGATESGAQEHPRGRGPGRPRSRAR